MKIYTTQSRELWFCSPKIICLMVRYSLPTGSTVIISIMSPTFVWNFCSNSSVYPRVIRGNKRGCFCEHSVEWSGMQQASKVYTATVSTSTFVTDVLKHIKHRHTFHTLQLRLRRKTCNTKGTLQRRLIHTFLMQLESIYIIRYFSVAKLPSQINYFTLNFGSMLEFTVVLGGIPRIQKNSIRPITACCLVLFLLADDVYKLIYQVHFATQTSQNNRIYIYKIKLWWKAKLIDRINKNLAIANRSHVSCAHNTSRAFIGLITLWP